ncbi:MAG: hypothetical protein WC015_08855 [Methanoregula sp.]|jgi:hypothetical protein
MIIIFASTMEKGFRNAAVTAKLWIRSKHGMWWFFLITPSTLVEIDRDGKRIVTGQAVAYLAGIGAREQAGGIYLVEEPECSSPAPGLIACRTHLISCLHPLLF